MYVCISNNDVRSIMKLRYFTNPIKGGTSHNLPNLIGFFILTKSNIMSVTSQIKNDWKMAIDKALPIRIIDRSNQIQIAVDSRGNEYFITEGSETDKTFRVSRPDGINCSVWKKGFRLRWVKSNYNLNPLIW